MGRAASLGISKVGQTGSLVDKVSDMAPACQLCGSVGGGLRKGTMASAHLEARHFSFSQFATGPSQVATPVLEPRESEPEYMSLCVGSLRGTAWGSRSFFH